VEVAKTHGPLPTLTIGPRRPQLGSPLLRDGLLTPEQLEVALAEKEQSGGRLGEIVVERQWVSPDDLRLALGPNVRLAVASAPDLHSTIARVYRTQVETIEELDEPVEEETIDDIREGAATSAPAIKLVNSLIARAIDAGASDLHVEPQAKQLVVRARVDCVMREMTTISKSMQPASRAV
jgi:type II secretory ATPase GspE/PulE/Tfp pilus assembly ATPase PilB-like protein